MAPSTRVFCNLAERVLQWNVGQWSVPLRIGHAAARSEMGAMNERKTESWRSVAVIGVLMAALGCWKLPNLDGPYFDWIVVSMRVYTGVASRNPLPESSETELEPALLGTWEEFRDEPTIWTFEARSPRRYRLQISARDTIAEFEGTLHRLGSDVFLSLSLSPFPGDAAGETSESEFPPFYAFFKLIVTGDMARLEAISPSWMREMIDAGQLQIDHEVDASASIILTAPGPEIASFLERFANDPEAFSLVSGVKLRR